MAFPPRSRTCTPARAASGWLAATMPNLVATFDRPAITRGREESACGSWELATAPAHANARMTTVMSRMRMRRYYPRGAHDRRLTCRRTAVADRPALTHWDRQRTAEHRQLPAHAHRRVHAHR